MLDTGSNHSIAYGINNSGQIVGEFQAAGQTGANRTAFLYSNGQLTNLGLPKYKEGTSEEVATKSSTAYAINDSGQIVMQARDGHFASFIYHSAEATPRMEAIPFLEGPGRTFVNSVRGSAINNHGTVIGDGTFFVTPEGQTSRLFVYADGTHRQEVKSLPEYGYDHPYSMRFLEAKAINDNGAILGWSHSNGVFRSFIYDSNVSEFPVELGTLPGDHEYGWADSTYAEDMNNAGQVVGSSSHGLGSEANEISWEHAFIYQNGSMKNLNSLVSDAEGITFTTAYGINNWGQIVAQGVNAAGEEFAYFLNPNTFLSSVTQENGKTTQNVKVIAGMQYSAYETADVPEGSFAATIIGGIAGGQRDLYITYTGENGPGNFSEVIDIEGTEDDVFVLEIAYDPALAEIYDIYSFLLGWLDEADGTWKNAVEGNSSDFAQFILGAFDADEHLVLGYYGINPDDHTVWAVLDHNSLFSVIPEPSTWAFLFLGSVTFGFAVRRQCKQK